MGDERVLADPLVGLTQAHAMLLGEAHQPFSGAMHELGVGREGDGLLLHGGVDDDLGEVLWARRPGPGRDGKTLLHQRGELLLAHALAPTRQ